MRKNLLVVALGAIFGSFVTYLMKDDQLTKLRIRHRVELSNEGTRSFYEGWVGAKDFFGTHPHVACTTCHPSIKK